MGDAVLSAPAVANGVVYVGCDGINNLGRMYAFDVSNLQPGATTLQPLWQPTGSPVPGQTQGEIWSSPAVADGLVFVGSRDKSLYAFDAQTGVQQWQKQTGGEVSSCPSVANGFVYVGSNDTTLHAYRAEDGFPSYQSDSMGHEIHSSPAVVDGVVYIGSGSFKDKPPHYLKGIPAYGALYAYTH
jgi:eukaryotic-like serine/threonine-protein kinase